MSWNLHSNNHVNLATVSGDLQRRRRRRRRQQLRPAISTAKSCLYYNYYDIFRFLVVVIIFELTIPTTTTTTKTIMSSVLVDAHIPYFERSNEYSTKNPFILDNPVKSTAIYAKMEHPTDVDVFEIQIQEVGTRIYAQLLVPVCDVYTNFGPSMAIVGPILEVPNIGCSCNHYFNVTNATETLLPCNGGISSCNIPNGSDIVIMQQEMYDGNGGQRPTLYASYIEKEYYRGPVYDELALSIGTYKVIIWDPNHKFGDYVIVLGKEEFFESNWELARSLLGTLLLWFNYELDPSCPGSGWNWFSWNH